MRRLLLLCAVLWLIPTAVAQAATPAPADDTLAASPTGVLDVLANDVDADTDILSASLTTGPAHGTVTCSALGSCFYRADAGYTGPDEFTYSASDGTTSATAKVTVTVAANAGAGAIAAAEDDAATRAGTPVTINVLANDNGAPALTVDAVKQPSHGSVSCPAAGACVYTPTAGFTGRDAFIYTLKDATGATREAAAHIAVVPADADYAASANGAPEGAAALKTGGTAAWTVNALPVPGDLASDELGALAAPTLTATPQGPHALIDGSVRAAAGWSTDGAKATAGSGALLGAAVAQKFPPPLPPISQGTGGDGHVPILVGTKVFAFFHHQSPTRVSCVDRLTGAVCPGYPRNLNFGTDNAPGPGRVVGTKIWAHLFPSAGQPSDASSSLGLFCWDAKTDSPCGYAIAARVKNAGLTGQQVNGYGGLVASAPAFVGGQLWFAGMTGRLYCVTAATGDPCATASIDLGLSGDGTAMDVVSHGSRVFVSRGFSAETRVACADVAAGGLCPGWPAPKSTAGATSWDLVIQYDTSAAAIGVCHLTSPSGTGTCYSDSDPSATTAITGYPATDGQYSVTQEAETGTRTLAGSLSSSGLGCYDWTTKAPCTGPGFGPDGRTTTPLPTAYGAVFDGGCVIALGDPGDVFTVDPQTGQSPCTSLRSGAGTQEIDLRTQRCDGTVGRATWGSIVLTDATAAELDGLTVTLRDARTGAALKTGELVNGGTLDISGVDATAHPAVIVDGSVQTKGGQNPWADGIPPRIVVRWSADPQELCVRSAVPPSCGAAQPDAVLVGRLLTPARESRAALPVGTDPCGVAASTRPKPAPRCSGRRFFKIRVRYRGSKVKSVTVTANGKRQKVLRLRPRPVAQINLKTKPKAVVTVKIRIVRKDGRVVTGKRVYRTCTIKGPDRGFKL